MLLGSTFVVRAFWMSLIAMGEEAQNLRSDFDTSELGGS